MVYYVTDFSSRINHFGGRTGIFLENYWTTYIISGSKMVENVCLRHKIQLVKACNVKDIATIAWTIAISHVQIVTVTLNPIMDLHSLSGNASYLQGPLLLIWFNFPAWINNRMPSKVWDKITYP